MSKREFKQAAGINSDEMRLSDGADKPADFTGIKLHSKEYEELQEYYKQLKAAQEAARSKGLTKK